MSRPITNVALIHGEFVDGSRRFQRSMPCSPPVIPCGGKERWLIDRVGATISKVAATIRSSPRQFALRARIAGDAEFIMRAAAGA
jgi:hypothetical protein